MTEKYSTSNKSVESILNDIKTGDIVIPEIQRPFVWKPKQVRDLIDSLYTGYPTGYLIISQSPNIKLRDGRISQGEKIMIDGQQRVTAMMTAILGMEVINAKYQKKAIKIAFNPLANQESDEEIFKVQDNAVLRDKRWIANIKYLFEPDFDSYTFIQKYCENNPGVSPQELNKKIMQLINIKTRQIGVITLHKELEIDEVTEIFIRINNQGTKLNQADFAMSKIAANTKYGGNILRKAIDYFSHLAVSPEWYSEMLKDREFCNTTYFQKMEWLKNDRGDIYDPSYGDILRVAFMSQFKRGKMKDLVSLLSGRDFLAHDYKDEIAEESFEKLTKGTLAFMNENSFKNFILTLTSAGFVSSNLINSQMTLNFAYTLYLLLREDATIPRTQINRLVAKWYVLSTLTSRYISSPESMMDADMKRITDKGFVGFQQEVEAAELSDTFWEIGLVQNLETSVINSPYFNVFLAAQSHAGDNSLFMNGTKVSHLITLKGDVHHIFPKKYLLNNNILDKTRYNQIANYTYLDTTTNISVGKMSPKEYFNIVLNQCDDGKTRYGNITIQDVLLKNLEENCIPQSIFEMEARDYDDFLLERRKLMAQKIKEYYFSL